MKKILFMLPLIMFISIQLPSQSITPQRQMLFNVDYARFQNDTSGAYLEIYIALYQRLFTSVQKNDREYGAARIEVTVKDRSTGELFNEQVMYLPVIQSEIGKATSSTVVSQMGYLIPAGNYNLNVMIADSLAPERKDSITIPLEIEPHKFSITVSDIQLCSNIKRSSNTSNPFYKNSLEVFPNPNLLFGVAGHPVVFSYAEIYNLQSGKNYYIISSIADRHGEVMAELKKKVQYDFRNAVEIETMNITSYPSGRYLYQVAITDTNGSTIATAGKPFFVNNPHIAQERGPMSVYSDELALLSFEELGEEFRQCRYIATDEDRRRFNEFTTADERRAFLSQFWAETAQGRYDDEPRYRSEYLARVEEANDRFRTLGTEGWLTDRGRVFLLYGNADEIERYPSSGQIKPYEIWRYYQIENGVEFVFVDRSGYGEYVLIHSTKRGEFRDDAWRQYLR